MAIYTLTIKANIDPDFVEDALTALSAHDAVLGPTEDGGYYLLGLRACPPGLLHDLPWSVPETRERTLARLRAFRYTTHLLPGWFDVDTVSDLAKLRSLLEANVVDAPTTALELKDFEVPEEARDAEH